MQAVKGALGQGPASGEPGEPAPIVLPTFQAWTRGSRRSSLCVVGPGRTDADLGLGWVQTSSRPSPAMGTHHSAPRPVAGENVAEALSVQGQRAQGEVLEVVGFDHVPHRSDLVSREPSGLGAGAGWRVVEHAEGLLALPYAKAGFREVDDLECGASPNDVLGLGDGAEDLAFRLRRVWWTPSFGPRVGKVKEGTCRVA